MTEWKNQQEYNTFLKGNELHISNKTKQGEFNLFTCNSCQSHFDNIDERDTHQKTHCNHKEDGMSYCKECDPYDEWTNHPSANLSDSDFKDGGKVF